jgi:hypothetical protein
LGAALRKILSASAIAVLACWNAAPANADEACARKFDRIGNELDALADRYDKMADEHKSMTEVCDFIRNTDIPLSRKILAEVEGLRNRCATGPTAVAMAKKQLNESIAREKKECHGAAGGSSKR